MLGYIVIASLNVAAVAVTLAVRRLRRWHRDAVRRAEITGYLDGMAQRETPPNVREANVTRLTPRRS